MTRFDLPPPGAPSAVRFPPIRCTTLASGLAVWTMAVPGSPVATLLLVVDAGSAHDPADAPGLVGLTADLMDEGAGGRDAIALADAFLRLGTHLDIDVAPDVTTFGVSCLSRVVPDSLALIADVVLRPHLASADFARVRDLRLNRLRQLSRSASTQADRAFVNAVFAGHPYGHGTLGTTQALSRIDVDAAQACWSATMGPGRATLIAAGDVDHEAFVAMAARGFEAWRAIAPRPAVGAPPALADRSVVLLVDRPGAPQSELRVGHVGPVRQIPDYHAFVTLNAVLGGQFSSRLNRNLRETRAITYGARSALDMRRAGSAFECQTSVQADATAVAVAEILREIAAVAAPGSVTGDELALARESLTRGYALNFETAVQFARAAVQLHVHGFGAEVFDEFVPRVGAVTAGAVTAAAQAHLRPQACTAVVVGDRAVCERALEALGLPVAIVTPAF